MSVIRVRCSNHPDVMFVSVCVPLLEGVRIGEERHVYYWGNSDEINPDENVCYVSSRDVCHVSSGDVCHVWGGVPTITSHSNPPNAKTNQVLPWMTTGLTR